ncbi:hypothetical protein C5B42_01925 [Candidatus Cerribacteria bacterium 'Amazon FNV 2010 28 9']|uniref:CPBP family intramembrane metalloprotease n=1 Tax=Candidatus Cerribacteria bacterium 'Amazon FNV 2010 28 9' TaxID=2081795 RepID=A0A317JUJ9_9BACT|nr:MAG: hypothetical protein C5B42_01925 [Candidatus Cerribacteria bacterium 'Amazon FNV 2010 28 9']
MKKKSLPKRSSSVALTHSQMSFFWVLLILSFLALLLYRVLFTFPVWVDEVIMKLFVFGLPFILFARSVKKSPEFFGLGLRRFWPGAFYGLAMGGIFGFVALITSAVQRGHAFIPYVFASTSFWYQFGLAFVTAWWESLFFYGLIMSVLYVYYKKDEMKASLMTTGLFLLFHAPILFIRVGFLASLFPLALLAFFAFGQAVMYLRCKALTSVVVSHAFWGMALLVYTMR